MSALHNWFFNVFGFGIAVDIDNLFFLKTFEKIEF